MACANCMSAVWNTKERNYVLQKLFLTHEEDQVTVLEALTDMLGHPEKFRKLLTDLNSSGGQVPFLCPICYDVLCQNFGTRKEFVNKCHKDGFINSLLSLVVVTQEKRKRGRPPGNRANSSQSLIATEPAEPTPKNTQEKRKRGRPPGPKSTITKVYVTDHEDYKTKFKLRDSQVVLTRCDEVQVKVERRDDVDDEPNNYNQGSVDGVWNMECTGNWSMDNDNSSDTFEPPEIVHDADDDDHDDYMDYVPDEIEVDVQVQAADHQVSVNPLQGQGKEKRQYGRPKNCSLQGPIATTSKGKAFRTCTICKQIFKGVNAASNLEVHTAQKHLKAESWTCPVVTCGKIYYHHKALLKHRSDQHSNRTYHRVRAKAETLRKRQKFKCNKCRRTFTNESIYQDHVKHHEEGIFSDEDLNEEITVNDDDADRNIEFQGRKVGQRSATVKKKRGNKDHLMYPTSSHTRTLLNDSTACRAPGCYVICDSEDTLQKHVGGNHVKHEEQTPCRLYLCNCGFLTGSLYELGSHKTTCTSRSLTFYQQVDTIGRHRCDICHEDFSFSAELYAHSFMKHDQEAISKSEQEMFSCRWTDCGFKSYGLEDLSEHIFEHTMETRFKCTFSNCEFLTGTVEGITDHWRIHMFKFDPSILKSSFCVKCGQLFRVRQTLKVHIAEKHDRSQEMLCENCGKVFYHKESLRKHMVAHTDAGKLKNMNRRKKTPGVEVPGEKRPVDEVPILCMKWDNPNTPSTLVQKLYCPECPKTFAFKSALLVHIHLNHRVSTKFFHCPNCEFKCESLKLFLAHINAWAKERLYKCMDCGTSIQLFDDFRRHNAKHKRSTGSAIIFQHCTDDNTSLECPNSSECQKRFVCRNAHCNFVCGTEEEWTNHKECGFVMVTETKEPKRKKKKKKLKRNRPKPNETVSSHDD